MNMWPYGLGNMVGVKDENAPFAQKSMTIKSIVFLVTIFGSSIYAYECVQAKFCGLGSPLFISHYSDYVKSLAIIN